MTTRSLADLELAAQEAQHLAALERTHGDQVGRIRDLRRGGMSRRRLIDTYGQELVDIALSGG